MKATPTQVSNRTIGVQVDSRTVTVATVPQGASEEEATRAALALPEVLKKLGPHLSARVVLYKPDRIIGFASCAPGGTASHGRAEPCG
jgi:hypothetical protein